MLFATLVDEKRFFPPRNAPDLAGEAPKDVLHVGVNFTHTTRYLANHKLFSREINSIRARARTRTEWRPTTSTRRVRVRVHNGDNLQKGPYKSSQEGRRLNTLHL